MVVVEGGEGERESDAEIRVERGEDGVGGGQE